MARVYPQVQASDIRILETQASSIRNLGTAEYLAKMLFGLTEHKHLI